ncbi:hypothetical protein DYB25_005769 [Aphanomyces astaci]|uniref:Transcription factor CBF/NF-Y/archaeal histone domain-containing protein n=1 Tax=Aphanomyces astaci TaxID=112090 RepID=A0A397C315_APHAT|nr:hypothetical protein DYB25_005769 [Aphanomyces astaci]
MPDPTRNYGAPLDPQRDYPFLYAPSTRARQSYEDLSNDFRKSTDKFSTSTKSHFKRLTDSQERMIERLRDGPDLTPIRSDPMAAPSPATNDIRRSNRLRKPNSKYEHFATATLDTALEGYQPDDDDEGTEENATYRIGGTEFACAAAALVQMALYGLNQSGHEWELHCKKQIATLGWNQSPYDPCVFTRGHGADMEMLGTYVDDFIVATPSQDKMNKIMDELSSKMNLKRQGPLHYMLGVRITRSADLRTLTMTQDAYTEKNKPAYTELHTIMSSKDDLNDDEIREQDRFLPTANISRIMKVSLPNTAKIAKDGKETVQECVSEFISFITSEASDKCQQEKRKTINGDDIIWAMSTLGFDSYVEPLKLYLQKYRESVKVEKSDKKDNVGSFGASS